MTIHEWKIISLMTIPTNFEYIGRSSSHLSSKIFLFQITVATEEVSSRNLQSRRKYLEQKKETKTKFGSTGKL